MAASRLAAFRNENAPSRVLVSWMIASPPQLSFAATVTPFASRNVSCGSAIAVGIPSAPSVGPEALISTVFDPPALTVNPAATPLTPTSARTDMLTIRACANAGVDAVNANSPINATTTGRGKKRRRLEGEGVIDPQP